MCEVYTGYHGTSEIVHGLCTCTVDYPLSKAWGLSLHTGTQTTLYPKNLPRKVVSMIEMLNKRMCMPPYGKFGTR